MKGACLGHSLILPEIESYPKNSIIIAIGRGNNAGLIRELFKKRWWWSFNEEKSRKICNMTWTQLKEKTFYDPEFQLVRNSSGKDGRTKTKDTVNNSVIEDLGGIRIHNHFEFN